MLHSMSELVPNTFQTVSGTDNRRMTLCADQRDLDPLTIMGNTSVYDSPLLLTHGVLPRANDICISRPRDNLQSPHNTCSSSSDRARVIE